MQPNECTDEMVFIKSAKVIFTLVNMPRINLADLLENVLYLYHKRQNCGRTIVGHLYLADHGSTDDVLTDHMDSLFRDCMTHINFYCCI